MRILQLRFQNLNSLVGECQIDLTHPEYTSEGIFVITGQTGAGKSTILDAICLALYGRTPRLSKVNKSINEIMSRHTGECFAEVTLETQSGRFRCHWSQHRSRRKAGGDLQVPKHEIAKAESGTIVDSTITGVANTVESVTGMDFERFTRSMLLAQGGFAAFLQATADERSPILEQLTGTKIYSDISVAVHERHKQEKDKLDGMRAAIQSIVILAPDEQQKIEQQLQQSSELQTRWDDTVKQTQKSIHWLETIDRLEKDIADVRQEEKRLEQESEGFSDKRQQLALAQKAAELDGSYATLIEIRKQQSQDQKDVQEQKNALPELQDAAKLQAEGVQAAEQRTSKVKKQQQQEAPLIQQVRLLDQKITTQAKTIAEAQQLCQEDRQQIEEATKSKKSKEAEKKKVIDDSQSAKQYLKEHKQDEWLTSGLTGIEQQLNSLQSQQRDIKSATTELEQAKSLLDQAQGQHLEQAEEKKQQERRLDTAIQEQKKSQAALAAIVQGRALRDYRNDKEHLLREMSLLARINDLEDHRQALEEGKPCPLCGAQEHPFAQGHTPEKSEVEQEIAALTQRIDRAEQQEAQIQKRAVAEDAARIGFLESEKKEAAAAHELKTAEEKHRSIDTSIRGLQVALNALKQSICEQLLPLGIEDNKQRTISELRAELTTRLRQWQQSVSSLSDVEQCVTDLDSRLAQLDAVIASQSIALSGKQQTLDELQKEHQQEREKRYSRYADKQPDDEERALNQAIEQAEKIEKKQRQEQQQAQKRLESCQEKSANITSRMQLKSPELQTLETDFVSAVQGKGFANEQQLRDARLSLQQRNDLAEQAKRIDDKHKELATKGQDRQDNLTTEQAKQLTEKALPELQQAKTQAEQEQQQLRDEIARLKQRITSNAEAQERSKEKQQLKEEQSKEHQRWKSLHELIGSADGKKYRNFAQGLTFELMVAHANQQLKKMTDRYSLIRDTEKPLELNVIDGYQADEVRSTKNLSGGESFIVSLSLALGLSAMASQKVRVDSLFLDEGFGTLDEDALEAALVALAGLHQEGKLIGVISHVPALKESISCQIQVKPITPGRSTISGPGCSFENN